MDDRNLDTAIDDVAREMTAGKPDASFRARVLARIDPRFGIRASRFGIRDSGFGRWRPAVAALAAAAALVASVLVFQSPHERRMRETPVTQAPPAPAAPAQTTNGTWRPALAGPREGSHGVVRLKPDTTYGLRTGRRNDAPDPASEIDALAPPPLDIAPLDVESIAVSPLPSPNSIRLDNLEPIMPIAVTPLGEGDRS